MYYLYLISLSTALLSCWFVLHVHGNQNANLSYLWEQHHMAAINGIGMFYSLDITATTTARKITSRSHNNITYVSVYVYMLWIQFSKQIHLQLFISGPSNYLFSLYHRPLQLGMQRCTSIWYKCPATGSSRLTYCHLDTSPRTMYHQILLLTFYSLHIYCKLNATASQRTVIFILLYGNMYRKLAGFLG